MIYADNQISFFTNFKKKTALRYINANVNNNKNNKNISNEEIK